MRRADATQVHPVVERLAAYSWRILVIVAVGVAVLWLIGELWVVFLPLVLAAFLSRVLIGPVMWLRGHGWRPALAAAAVLVGFLIILSGIIGGVGVAIGHQSDRLGPTVSKSIDDIEDWLVTDAPGDLTRTEVADARKDAGKAIENWLRTSGGALVSGVVVAFEVLVGLFLGLIITFFALKDGDRLVAWIASWLPAERRDHAGRLGQRAWVTLGGYLRGSAILGILEGIIIGTTVALVGGQLAVAVAVITFLSAFIPFAGAIIAGAVAVLVTLSTAGIGGATIVLVVAIIVQQFDSDLLAPLVFGRSLDLHPVVVLLAITGGGAMFGLAGAFLAVPVTAIIINVIAEHRRSTSASVSDDDAGGSVDRQAATIELEPS